MMNNVYKIFVEKIKLSQVWKSNKLQVIGSGFLVIFSFMVLGWLVYKQRDFLLSYSWKINVVPLLVSVILYGFTLFIVIYVWSRIMKCFGNPLSFGEHFRFYCLSALAKRLPGTVWYVVWRAQMYQKEGFSMMETSLSSAIEVAVSVISGMFVVAVFSVSILLKYQLGYISFIVVVLLGLFTFRPKVIKRIFFYFAKREVDLSYKELLYWVFLYFLAWVISGVLLWTIILAIYPVPVSTVSFVIGAWTLVGVLSTVLFFLPTNFGLNQVGISLLLSSIMPSPIAVIVAVLSRILLTVYETGWALVAYGMNLKKSSQ